MAAAVVTTKAYLLKKGVVRLQFVGSNESSERILLFTANPKTFTSIPDETYDAHQIKLISEALEEAAKLGDNKPKIEMSGAYDTFYKTLRIYTKVSFPQGFVKSLSNILPEPKISIKGTYKVLQQMRGRFQLLSSPQPAAATPPSNPNGQLVRSKVDLALAPILLRFQRRPPSIQIMPGHEGGSVREVVPHVDDRNLEYPHLNWTPVDNNEVEFSVEGLELKENATYEGFKGLEKLNEYYRSGGYTNAQLSYSVILEWKEFEKPNENFTESILEKLFNDKLLADCVIKVSNEVELKCHRNILGVNSDVFLTMFEVGMLESQTRIIDMEDVSEEGAKLMLDYMYGRNLYLEGRTEEEILEVLKAAHKYNVSGLELMVSQFLWCKPMEWFTMDGVLAFYFFAKNVDALRNFVEKLEAFMKGNTRELLAAGTYQEWMEKDAKAASKFVLELFGS